MKVEYMSNKQTNKQTNQQTNKQTNKRSTTQKTNKQNPKQTPQSYKLKYIVCQKNTKGKQSNLLLCRTWWESHRPGPGRPSATCCPASSTATTNRISRWTVFEILLKLECIFFFSVEMVQLSWCWHQLESSPVRFRSRSS